VVQRGRILIAEDNGNPIGWLRWGLFWDEIPFMNMLGVRFPRAQFLITGVLGPGSNAHGPNEFLDLNCARKLSLAVASVVASIGQE